MARTFNGSTQYGGAASTAVTGLPATMSLWFKTSSTAVGGRSLGGPYATDTDQLLLYCASANARVFTQGSGGNADTSLGAYSTTLWNHIGGVWTNSTTRAGFLNGSKTSSAATGITHATWDSFALARNPADSIAAHFDGTIAEFGVWNVALDDAEMGALSKGVSPLLIRPQSLVSYWPLYGNESPELDRARGNISLTLTASPAKAEGPRVYLPTGFTGN